MDEIRTQPQRRYGEDEASAVTAARVAKWRASGLHGDQTIPQVFEEAARLCGQVFRSFHSDEREARTLTLAEAFDIARDWAARLQRLGLMPGDTVAIQMPNWWEAWLLGQAVLIAGGRLLPVHFMHVGVDLDYVLRVADAKFMILAERVRGRNCLERIDALSRLPALRTVIVLGERSASGARLWSEVLSENPSELQLAPMDSDDACVLLFTSGTTARPKGVLHTHNSLLAEARSFAGYRPIDPANPTLLSMSVYGHIASMIDLVRAPVSGVNEVVRDRWDARACLELITRYRPSSANGAPFHLLSLFDLLDEGVGDISSIKYFSMGATTISPSHIQLLEDRGIAATRVYGSTEHPTVVSGDPDDPLLVRATTDGKLLAEIEVRVVDDDGNDVPHGSPGELVTRGPDMFVGYVQPEMDAAAWLPGGYFRTGDIATLNTDGYVTIVDRKKDIIIRGGENLSSKEIEDALVLHAGAREAAVVATPDPRYGERVCAFVSVPTGASLTLDDVRTRFAAAGIAKQKAPERLEVVAEFPRTPNGKIRKTDLRARLLEGSAAQEADAPLASPTCDRR